MNLIADYRFIDTDFRHEARGKKKDEGFAAEKGEKEFAQSDFCVGWPPRMHECFCRGERRKGVCAE